MYKTLILFCVVLCVVIEARPSWQFLPSKPGYVPVYIQNGDTPLEEINPDLAEAFHALPSGRSAGKLLDAAPEIPASPEQAKPEPEIPDDSTVDRRPYEKKFLEKKTKKATDIVARR